MRNVFNHRHSWKRVKARVIILPASRSIGLPFEVEGSAAGDETEGRAGSFSYYLSRVSPKMSWQASQYEQNDPELSAMAS